MKSQPNRNYKSDDEVMTPECLVKALLNHYNPSAMKSYKEKENRIDVSGIRNAQIINEIEKVSNLNLSYRYRMAIIQRIIEDWRGNDEDE